MDDYDYEDDDYDAYYDYETSSGGGDGDGDDHFIDENNYSLTDNEVIEDVMEQVVDQSVLVIESDDEESRDDQPMDVHIDNITTDANPIAQEVELKCQETTNEAKQPMNVSMCTQENGDNSCIICTEMWTNTGVHQLVSLSCGHLFGRQCIEQWLNPKNQQNHRCPQCNSKAKRKDIRILYARNLRALDTSEKDEALELLRKERCLRERLEADAIESCVKLKSALEENERIKKELIECQQRLKYLGSNSRNTERIISKSKTMTALQRNVERFQYVKDIEISCSGECRHLGYYALCEIIAVSQPNPNSVLFPGFGVKKIFLNDFKTDNICIHTKPIKDLEVNVYDGTILTASSDRTVKLTSLLQNTLVSSYNLESEPWSVAFNPKSRHEFYVGLHNGQILLFDSRMMSSHVDRLVSNDRSPVVSLNHIQFKTSVGCIDGILSTQFNNFSFYKRNKSNDSLSASNFSNIKIPFEGRFGSAHFEHKSGLILLSCRPSSKHTNVTHYVMDLKVSEDSDDRCIIEPEIVRRYEGGKQQIKLSRSRIFNDPLNANSALVCAGDEDSKGALVWDLSSTKHIQQLKSESTVLDMSLLENINTNCYFMTSLTETSVKFYKFIS